MQIPHVPFSNINCKDLILSISLFSLLLGWRLIYIEHGWVNDDFVLYHEVARLFAAGEYKEGFKLYNWPLYPALISALHCMTGLSLLVAAQCLNILFFGLTTLSFLYLILIAGGGKVTIVAGALLLFSAHYITGDVVAMLVRDPGFWGFFLTSLIFFIQYCRQPSTKNALLWPLFAIIATLFRIEGLTFLVFLPLMLLTTDFANAPKITPFTQRVFLYLKANTLNVAILVGLIALFILTPNFTIKDLGRLQEVAALFDNKIDQTFITIDSRADLLAAEVLKGHFDDYALQGLFFALFGVTVLKIIGALGWLNLGLSSYYFFNKLQGFNSNVLRILTYIAILAFVNIFVILLSVMLLSTRYIVPFVLIMLIFASFGLGSLLESFIKLKRHRIQMMPARVKLLKAAIFIIMLSILGGLIGNILPKKASNNFEQEAVTYLTEQKISNKRMFFVSPRVRFYAGADYAGRGYDHWDYIQNAIEDKSIYQFDYLLLNLHVDEKYENNKQILDKSLTQYQLIKEFYSYKKKKKVMVYKKNNL